MATYIICEDLGPSYFIRKPDDGEDISGHRTIELTDLEFDSYKQAEAAWGEWSNRLHKAYRGK